MDVLVDVSVYGVVDGGLDVDLYLDMVPIFDGQMQPPLDHVPSR